MMKNKFELPFRKGDILEDRFSKKILYINSCEFVEFAENLEDCLLRYNFSKIGEEGHNECSTLKVSALFCVIRYGNISDVGMTEEEVKLLDFSKIDYKERGYKQEKIYRDLRLRFLLSY